MLPMNDMTVPEVLDALRKIIDDNKSSKEPSDTSKLEEAVNSLEHFLESDLIDSPAPKVASNMPEQNAPEGVIDTGLLTGSISGLKNFLLKNQRDNEDSK